MVEGSRSLLEAAESVDEEEVEVEVKDGEGEWVDDSSDE